MPLHFQSTPPWRAALLAATLALAAAAQATPVGSGSYRDGLPASNPADAGWAPPSQVNGWTAAGKAVYGPAMPRFKSGVPAASNRWWSGLGWTYWGTQSSGLNSVPNFPLPLAFMATPAGVGVWQADQPSLLRVNGNGTDWMAGTVIDGMEFLNNGYPNSQQFSFYDQDLVAGLAGLASGDPLVAAHSDWAVTAEWSSGAHALQVSSASGSPYLFFRRTAGSADARVEVSGGLNVFFTNGNVLGLSVSKAAAEYRPGTMHHYLLVAPTGVNWTQSGSVFTAALGSKGYFTVAALPDTAAATVNEYAGLAHNHITDTRLSWSYDEATASLTSTYTFSTQNPDTGAVNGPTLTAVFPHTWKGNLNNPVNTGYAYASPRGQMKVVRATAYTSRMRFNGLLPVLPVAAADVSRLNGYVDEIINDPAETWQNPPEGTIDDAYWTARALGRLASLLSIAAQTGHTTARDRLLGEIKPRLQDWLTYTPGESGKHWAYDGTWRTLCPIYDMHFACRDLSDHHFINGYFVRAAAMVALYDPDGAAWAGAWGPMVEQLIKDPMNWDRTDTRYAFLRHYSPVEGHSWASGIAFGNGLNEESSSEAMNFATGAALWGMATGNRAIRDMAIMYYVNQTRAIEEYWFDVDQANHAADFRPPHLGVVWGNGGVYGTWWSAEPRAVLGINLLPITSGSVYLGRRPDQVARQISAMNTYQAKYQGLPAPTGDATKPLMGELAWSDLFWSFQATSDPAGMLAQFNANSSLEVEWGQTRADIFHFLAAFDTLGTLDTGVTASVPSYNVFSRNGVRNYSAFNPGNSSVCVSFSDGHSMAVPAKQVVVNGASCSGDDTTPPSAPTALTVGTRTAASVALSWAAASDNVGVTGYQVLRNGAVVGSPAGTSFSDTGLAAATSYTYAVKAQDAAGNVSDASDTASATTLSGRLARDLLQAEDYAEADGRITRTAGSTAVGTTLDGTWIRLAGVDFGSTSPVDFVMRLASGLNGSGSIRLYTDSLVPANQIAAISVGHTGGWSSWMEPAMNLSVAVTGVHDLIIEFRTPYVDANGLVNLDWIRFR